MGNAFFILIKRTTKVSKSRKDRFELVLKLGDQATGDLLSVIQLQCEAVLHCSLVGLKSILPAASRSPAPSRFRFLADSLQGRTYLVLAVLANFSLLQASLPEGQTFLPDRVQSPHLGGTQSGRHQNQTCNKNAQNRPPTNLGICFEFLWDFVRCLGTSGVCKLQVVNIN